jgi:hypothetical protein
LAAVFNRRVLTPMGVPAAEWRWRENDYRPKRIDGLTSREFASGITITHRALARLGYLYLREGNWNGQQLIAREFIRQATQPSDLPTFVPYYAFYWGSNARNTYPEIPPDTYWALGLGDSFVLVCPSLDLVAVRLGLGSTQSQLPGGDRPDDWGRRVAGFFRLVIAAVRDQAAGDHSTPATEAPRSLAPLPSSRVIGEVRWAPTNDIMRLACGSDNWPMTWMDDGALLAAYGDGHGFEPGATEKLSLGLARIQGQPASLVGVNIRAPSLEQKGDGAAGLKASGLLMVNGTLYLWARNAGNARLAWSDDRGLTWTWAKWKFTNSFGAPAFAQYGRDYAGARDDFVYIVSHDADSAYGTADAFVLARVARQDLRGRDAYEFFARLDNRGPVWTRDITQRGPLLRHPGQCFRASLSYNAGLGRYLLVHAMPEGGSHQTGARVDTRFGGGLAIYEAPDPWGPWATAFYAPSWEVGPGETAGFPTAWMSADGLTLWLAFSGNDCLSLRKAKLITRR